MKIIVAANFANLIFFYFLRERERERERKREREYVCGGNVWSEGGEGGSKSTLL